MLLLFRLCDETNETDNETNNLNPNPPRSRTLPPRAARLLGVCERQLADRHARRDGAEAVSVRGTAAVRLEPADFRIGNP